ncbi:Cut8 six-helix bundle-domain-containing protein [Spinellus fusiger]|nr:Cut8 six-helix bundle-domain-containing protein [Spinellus fusiger]
MSLRFPVSSDKGQKRRMGEDEDMDDAHLSTRSFVQKHRRTHEFKRCKTGIKKQTSSTALLATLSKEKLVSLLQDLLTLHPQVQQDMMTYVPAPTIASVTVVLTDMEKSLAAKFPYSRHGPGRDDYAFARVRESLGELTTTVTQYAHHFTSATVFPAVCFAFLDLAAHITHRLPVWEKEGKSRDKKEIRNLYRDLNGFWIKAIQSAASMQPQEAYDTPTMSDWAKSLAQHNSHTHGLLTEAVHEFTRLLVTAPPAPYCQEKEIHFSTSPVVGYADV